MLHALIIPFAKEVKLKDIHSRNLGILLIALHSILATILVVLTIVKLGKSIMQIYIYDKELIDWVLLGWGCLWFRGKKNPDVDKHKVAALSVEDVDNNAPVLGNNAPVLRNNASVRSSVVVLKVTERI